MMIRARVRNRVGRLGRLGRGSEAYAVDRSVGRQSGGLMGRRGFECI